MVSCFFKDYEDEASGKTRDESAQSQPGVVPSNCFPGYTGEDTLEHISWEEWFRKFDESNLAFLYQDKTKDGRESRFFKLVERT